jgi:L-ascorbate metabolism protein UlaG (beta-lactamase superfamily)
MKHPVTAALAGIALTMACLPALADDMIATAKGDLAIHPFHHASMLLTWNGVHILVDPAPAFGGPKGTDITAEYKATAAPDVILYTHDHGDHFNADILSAVAGKATIVAPKELADKIPAALKGQVKVLANGDTAELDGVPIEAVAMYNTTAERLKFHPQGGGNGYVLTLADKRVYIAGDTEETPEMKALANIDVAFLPMNLPYTMDIEHAAQAVKDFRPKIVYPYHYSGSDVTAFKTLVGDAAEVRLLEWYPKADM